MKTGGGQQPLVGSSPTASAFWGHGPTGRRHLRKMEIRVRLSVTPLWRLSPVVQRQRRLVHTQETMVRLHPGLLDRPGTPIGRAAWLGHRRVAVVAGGFGFDSGPGHGPVGNLADHLGLEPGMLWVRVPPGPLEMFVLVEQPGVLACLSRRRSRVQIPSRALSTSGGAVRKSAKRPSSNLGDCGFESHLRHSRTTCVGWASACPTACKAASPKGYAGSTPARRTQLARSSIGTGRRPGHHAQHGQPERRVQLPHGPLRQHDHVVELADTRRSERRALAALGVRLSPWSLRNCRRGWSLRNCRRGRCPTGSGHRPKVGRAGAPGSIPGPATRKHAAGGPVLSPAS